MHKLLDDLSLWDAHIKYRISFMSVYSEIVLCKIRYLHIYSYISEIRAVFTGVPPCNFFRKTDGTAKQKLRIAINGYRVVAVTYDRNRMPLEEESYYSYIIHEFFLKKFKEILALEHGGIFI